MKKFTLLFIATLFSALSFAALNPYAYGLKSDLSDDEKNVTLTYSLNADATSVNIVILDGETVVKTQTSTGTAQGTHSVEVSTDGFDKGKTLSWKVEVKGAAHNTTNNHGGYRLYHPSGVDVDNNPESPHFGRIICNEAMHSVKSKTDTYLSAQFGAGIFEFTPAFEPKPNGSKPGYNGGITFTTGRADDASLTAYAPRRVRISEDGRIFVSSLNTDGHVLWEVNPDNLDDWTEVIAGTRKTGDINSVVNGSGTYIGGPNAGLDVRGKGKDLHLALLSGMGTFQCNEYNLGTETSWNKAPSRQILGNKYIVSNTGTNIEYDNEGGLWFCQYRGSASTTEPALLYINANGEVDYLEDIANVRNGGFRFNPSFTKVITADGRNKSGTYVKGYARIYDVSKDANGKPVLTLWKVIDMSALGHSLNDFAWDIADNIYVVGHNSEWIRAYALARTADDVATTPCSSAETFSLTAPAQLNPFAYKLTSELSADEKNLTIKYSLNANATSVEWVLMDGNNVVKTVDLASLGLEKGDYTTTISTTDFPQYKQLTWKIEVKGVAVGEPTEYPVNHSIYHPSSVDIDNNPENETFGLLLVNEGMHAVKTKTTHADGSTYISSGFGAGIFAFNPAFENIGKYNGGITFTNTRADGTGTAYSPRRIRISEDGRIFVTSLNTDGNYLWEVNPKNMNEWTTVFKSASINTDKELVDASDSFIVGPNTGFDVKGSGSNLKLMMYSVNLRGITAAHADAFKCAEYNLGNEAEWSTKPSKTWIEGKYAITYNGTQVEYDNEGGFWVASYRGTATNTNPGLVHINKDGVATTFVWNNVRNAGIRFNHDYTKLVVAGYNGAAKKATIYTVSKNASGTPVLTEELVIDMAIVGNNLNDFAWDYAGNLYACGNSNEKLAVWAMPHSSEDVVATPAASKYAFSIGKYTVTVNTNDENKGTVTGGGEYGAGAVVTLTATPKEGYELLYWSDRSKENPRTITVDGNEALSAYFIKKNDVEPTFSITKVWENTNVPASTDNGYQGAGWDGKIYVKDRGNDKIVVYSDATTSGDYAQTDNADDQSIAVDDAGNLVLRSGSGLFYNAPTQIILYKKGETTYKTIDFTLPETGRCDFISASGDLFSAEGGYVYFYCQNKTGVSRLHIKNGGANASDVTVDFVGNITTLGNTQSHVMADIFGNLVTHARTNAIATTINAYTGESMNFTLPTNHKANALGGCSFELAGKEFWAFNVKGTNTCTSEWNLYNLTDGAFVSSDILYAKNTTDKNSAANWLNVQVVDEKTAYIYQFCPTVAAAVWKVTRDHIVSATAENGSVTGTGTYKDNETATLTATPNDGYLFKNWTKNGVVVSTENPYSFTVTEDVEMVANFDGPFCELILNTNDENKGTVSGAGFYTQGQTVTIEATPKDGYKLLYWSDRSTENPRNITMTKKEALSAYFVKVYDAEPTFTITKVWENTDVLTTTNNGFQAAGWDGKVYVKERLNRSISVYSSATDKELYLYTDEFTSADETNKGDQAIAIDNAGNIIVRSGSGNFFNAPKQITIYKKGEKTGKVIDFTLQQSARGDFMSASGDVFSTEGGYVYFYCQNTSVVNRIKITNGATTASDVTVDVIGENITTAQTQNNVMADIFGNVVAHARSTAINAVNVYTNESKSINFPSIKNTTIGGCSFELGGKELWAYNVGTTSYTSEWNLYNMTDGKFLSNETLYTKDATSVGSIANWLNVQVVDEKTAYIYQFCPKVGAAVWKVTCTTEKTVIIDENADNTTALAPYEGQQVDQVTVERDFTAGKCLTLTLPFDMNAAQISATFGMATVYEFTKVADGGEELYLEFSRASSIVAGKPYLIQMPTTGGYDAEDGFTIEDVTISTTLNPVTIDGITMVPVLDAGETLDQANQYYVSNAALYSAGTYPQAISGLRAYFTSSSPTPIRARVVFEENSATSIPMVETPNAVEVRKVLRNGQIIIIRGGEEYTVQGQRL